MIDELKNGGFFNSFMRDVIRELKKDKKSFVFSMEQVSFIQEQLKNVKYNEKDGIFYLTIA